MRNTSKLKKYLALTTTGMVSSTCASTIVTWYDGRPTDNGGSGPAGTDPQFSFSNTSVYVTGGVDGGLGIIYNGSSFFTTGGDLTTPDKSYRYAYYGSNASAYGAAGQTTGDFNSGYSNISFAGINETSNIDEAEFIVAFSFDGSDNGSVIGIASCQGAVISISEGFAAMQAASANNANLKYEAPVVVPEPSGLALLALGSGGVLLRRKRKAA